MADKKPIKQDDNSEISLSAPWDDGGCSQVLRNVSVALPKRMAESFVKERTRVHELYIREQERTKRLGLILAAVLILAAAATVLFAPQGREALSYWIGAALVIFAAGAGGYKRVWSKTGNSSFGADQDQRKL
jgi:hypothetical protein